MKNVNYNSKHVFNKRAFTLIELLIVIAIIGILFIVLVSKVDFATDKAKATGVQTDFRSFQVAFEQVARENSGYATLGWDTGDDNGDRIRNSYDKGDNGAGGGIAQNGIQDGTEVFVGSKTYGEDWTGTYTLVNPDDSKDASAFVVLENAINSNLDPKLHITITPNADASGNLTGSAIVTMANQARDPWKNEYHGIYMSNAQTDALDRGTILIYSDGANGKNGCDQQIVGGITEVIVPGSNVDGKDDYAIAVTYSYANGFGEVVSTSFGFNSTINTTFKNELSGNQQGVIELPWTPNNGNITVELPSGEALDVQIGNDVIVENAVVEQKPDGSININMSVSAKPVETSIVNLGTFKDANIVIPGTYVTTTVEKTYRVRKYSRLSEATYYQHTNVTRDELLQRGLLQYYGSDFIIFSMFDYPLTGYIDVEYKYCFECHYTPGALLDDYIFHAALWNDSTDIIEYRVAQWNGSEYVILDLEEEINSIPKDAFYETRVETETVEKFIQSAPPTMSDITYLATNSVTIVNGMTWNEWLHSGYNTQYSTNVIIRDDEYNVVDQNSVIDTAKSYVIREIKSFILDGSDTYTFEEGMMWVEFAATKDLHHPGRDFSYDTTQNTVMSSLFKAICKDPCEMQGTKYIRESIYDIIIEGNYVHQSLNMTVGK